VSLQFSKVEKQTRDDFPLFFNDLPSGTLLGNAGEDLRCFLIFFLLNWASIY